eukprot:7234208-Pyramimonas_sp.AAC.1
MSGGRRATAPTGAASGAPCGCTASHRGRTGASGDPRDLWERPGVRTRSSLGNSRQAEGPGGPLDGLKRPRRGPA